MKTSNVGIRIFADSNNSFSLLYFINVIELRLHSMFIANRAEFKNYQLLLSKHNRRSDRFRKDI